MSSKLSLFLMLLLAGVSVPVASQAAISISIANSNFDDPGVSDGGYSNFSIPSWSEPGSVEGYGLWIPSHVACDESTIVGLQVGYLNRGRIAQQLTTGVVPGATYHLNALFGTSYFGDFIAGGTLELWSGGTV